MPADPFAILLGVAQDAGHPQAGCRRPCCARAWADPTRRHLPVALGLVDGAHTALIEATPALGEQLHRLQGVAPEPVQTIFITHAHYGHYTGLLHLGRAGAATRGLRVVVPPRMADLLTEHQPWRELVDHGHIRLETLATEHRIGRLVLEPWRVPHRDELSETYAFKIRGPTRTALFLPDIDAWDPWDRRLEDVLHEVDVAWLDGTFWADGELPDRDMSEVPHPRIADTLARLARHPRRGAVRFVHLNHTNPALDPDSPEAAAVRAAGMAVATEGERFTL